MAGIRAGGDQQWSSLPRPTTTLVFGDSPSGEYSFPPRAFLLRGSRSLRQIESRREFLNPIFLADPIFSNDARVGATLVSGETRRKPEAGPTANQDDSSKLLEMGDCQSYWFLISDNRRRCIRSESAGG